MTNSNDRGDLMRGEKLTSVPMGSRDREHPTNLEDDCDRPVANGLISQRMQEMHARSDDLEKTIAALRARLKPIICERCTIAEKCDEKKALTKESAIADGLGFQVEQLGFFITRLQDLIESVQL